MQPPLGFEVLKDLLHRQTAPWPDHRTESPNTRYAIPDAALGAFGIFFTPSPSFLEYQRRLQHTQGHNNAQALFGVGQMPCDNPIRTLLDPLAPSHLAPVCVAIFTGLEPHHMVAPLRVLGAQLLVSRDGTTSFSSQTIHCPNCLPRQLANGRTLYDHSVLTPVMVCPGHPAGMALPPEYIMPQDGQAQPDGEQEAGKRWISKAAQVVAPQPVTILGDDRYSQQPFCALALPQGLHCILTCQPDSHATLSARLAFWQANDGIAALGMAALGMAASRQCGGIGTSMTCACVRVTMPYRSIGSRSRSSMPQPANTSLTTAVSPIIAYTRTTFADVAQAGRGRWKSENEKTNVLKTKGDHLEHNFGHGQHYLSAFLLSLNLLAFLFHTVVEWSDDQYALLRRVLARRQTFFEDIRALTRSMVFDSWDHLMNFMIQGLELQPQVDTS